MIRRSLTLEIFESSLQTTTFSGKTLSIFKKRYFSFSLTFFGGFRAEQIFPISVPTILSWEVKLWIFPSSIFLDWIFFLSSTPSSFSLPPNLQERRSQNCCLLLYVSANGFTVLLLWLTNDFSSSSPKSKNQLPTESCSTALSALSRLLLASPVHTEYPVPSNPCQHSLPFSPFPLFCLQNLTSIHFYLSWGKYGVANQNIFCIF